MGGGGGSGSGGVSWVDGGQTRTGPVLGLFNPTATKAALKASLLAGVSFLDIGDSNIAGLHSDDTVNGKRSLATPDRMGAYLNTGAIISANVDAMMGTNGFTTTYVSNYNNTKASYSGLWVATGVSSLGGNSFARTAGASAALFFSPALAHDRVEVSYLDIGTAQFTIESPSGSVLQTVTCTNTNNLIKVTNSTASLATQNIAIRSAGAISIAGVSAYANGSTRLRIINAGRNSWSTTEWTTATNNYSPLPALTAYAPKICKIQLGINDDPGVPVATFKTRIATLGNTVVAAGGIPILNVPVYCDPTLRLNQDDYHNALYEVSTENGWALLSRPARLGTYAQALANGDMYDGLHPSQQGCNTLGAFEGGLLEWIAT